MFVCCECYVLSGRGLCDGLISRPEESYRLWRVVVCDQETSNTRRLNVRYRAVKIQPQSVVTSGKQTITDIRISRFLTRHTVNPSPFITVKGATSQARLQFCNYCTRYRHFMLSGSVKDQFTTVVPNSFTQPALRLLIRPHCP
jgi:hypothetical protein